MTRLSRTRLLAIVASVATALPAAVLAHAPGDPHLRVRPRIEHVEDEARDASHRRGPRRIATAFIRVQNPTHRPVTVWVDGREVARIEPRGEARLGPYAPGRHEVRATCTVAGRTLELLDRTVHLHPHDVDRLVLPRDGDGLLRVANRWVEPVRVAVDGRPMGSIPAEGHRVLGPLDPGAHVLTITGPDGTVYLRRRFVQEPLELEQEALTPPAFARVVFWNHTGRTVVVGYAGGREIARVRPGRQVLPEVRTGRQTLVVRLPTGRLVERLDLLVNPYTGTRAVVKAPATAPLTVVNPLPVPVEIYRDGKLLGRVGPRDRRTFTVPVGPARYTADPLGRGGPRWAVRLDVDPWDGATLRVDPRFAVRPGAPSRLR